jgi:hypothetical protein
MPLPSDFVPPCLPTRALHPPTGEAWLHEIKHDGFRVIARKDGTRVRLYSRPGNDLTQRFPLIVEALVDAATNYQRSSRDAYLQRLGARELVEARGREVKASDNLFD